MDFKNEYLGAWMLQEPAFEKACEIWREYYEVCETFDKAVCRVINDRGVAIPTTGREMALVNRNARAQREWVVRRMGELGVSQDVALKAKEHVLKESR